MVRDRAINSEMLKGTLDMMILRTLVVGDAHGHTTGVFGGQAVSYAPRSLPTHPRTGNVAVRRPVPGSHVPFKCCVQIACSLQMIGNQRGVFVDRFRLASFDSGGDPPVQLGAIGLELRFVGHRTDKRMMEYILGLAGQAEVFDELGHDQVINDWLDAQYSQQT